MSPQIRRAALRRRPPGARFGRQLRRAALAALLALAGVTAGHAECYADYKAKREPPLQLQYGVIRLPDSACTDRAAARAEIARRIAPDGWKLLSLVSIFGPEGLEQRKRDAGANFLRY